MDPLEELRGFDAGRMLALIKAVGGRKVADAILRHEKTVKIEDGLQALFDKHGRRIPVDLHFTVCDPNKNFFLVQPDLASNTDYAERISRVHERLGIDTGITPEQFKQEIKRLRGLIRSDFLVAKITRGVCLPVVLPQFNNDIDGTFEEYLRAATVSCNLIGWHLFNKALKGETCILPISRHGELIARMKQGPVIGIHFPDALRGYSISASQKQMDSLPKGFILSGLDTLIALTMYPDVLACSTFPPGLILAAFYRLGTDNFPYTLYFKVRDTEITDLDFNDTQYIYSGFDGTRSSGLLFIG